MRKRSYRQYCGLAKSLDVIGGRWTLLIVRNLLLGPLRYTDLLDGLPGITTNLLADRLRELENAGVVEPVEDGYRLTARGRELEPAVHALGRWGQAYMERPSRGDAVSPDWGLVALKRRYRGVTAPTLVQLTIDGQDYTLVLKGPNLDVQRGTATAPDVTVRGSWPLVAARLLGRTPGKPSSATSALDMDGSRTAYRRFLRAFGASV